MVPINKACGHGLPAPAHPFSEAGLFLHRMSEDTFRPAMASRHQPHLARQLNPDRLARLSPVGFLFVQALFFPSASGLTSGIVRCSVSWTHRHYA